jgi:hypothetical protein
VLDLIRRPPHHPFMNRRRFLVTSLAGAVAAWAQQPGKVYRIVGLWTNPNPQMEDVLWQGLRELGWVEGQNFIFDRVAVALAFSSGAPGLLPRYGSCLFLRGPLDCPGGRRSIPCSSCIQ